MSEDQDGFFVGMFLAFFMCIMFFMILKVNFYVNVKKVTNGKEFINGNSSYKCIKTNELLKGVENEVYN